MDVIVIPIVMLLALGALIWTFVWFIMYMHPKTDPNEAQNDRITTLESKVNNMGQQLAQVKMARGFGGSQGER